MRYTVVRIITDTLGRIAATSNVYATREAAEKSYHELLAEAATSGRPCDSVTMLKPDGSTEKTEHYETSGDDAVITFDANGGRGAMAQIECVTGRQAVLTACAFTREGFEFAGWNTDYDGGGDAYEDGAIVDVAGSLALKAMWEAVEEDADGGDE